MNARRMPADFEPQAVRAAIVHADGHWVDKVIPANLGSYQQLVGGYLAVHDPHRRWRLYCHESNTQPTPKPSLPWNELATQLATKADAAYRVGIRGTAVIVGIGPNGQDVDVPIGVVDTLEQLAKSRES